MALGLSGDGAWNVGTGERTSREADAYTHLLVSSRKCAVVFCLSQPHHVYVGPVHPWPLLVGWISV